MASVELHRLYQLHRIDVSLLEIEKKLVALSGQTVYHNNAKASQLLADKAKLAFDERNDKLKDLEMQNSTFNEKIKAIDKILFAGTVTNTREIEAYESQKHGLKHKIDANDEPLLELYEEVPPLQKAFDEAVSVQKIHQQKLAEFTTKAATQSVELRAKSKELESQRPSALKGIDEVLMRKYEGIKKVHHGIGMARITREMTCEECGCHVAEKSRALLNEDRVVTCEECHRILFQSDGIL
jgi:uncharacterized protein